MRAKLRRTMTIDGLDRTPVSPRSPRQAPVIRPSYPRKIASHENTKDPTYCTRPLSGPMVVKQTSGASVLRHLSRS